MSDLVLEIGDIVEGTRYWNKNWGRGEVIRIDRGSGLDPHTEYAVVKYENGKRQHHFKTGTEEVRRIGRKIPVINISDLI